MCGWTESGTKTQVVGALTLESLEASFQALRDEPYPKPRTIVYPPWLYDLLAVWWPEYHAAHPSVPMLMAIRRWYETRGARFGRGGWNPGPPLPFPKDPPRG